MHEELILLVETIDSVIFVLGVTVKFTKETYSGTEGMQVLPEIVVSAGDITQPTTIR